MKGICKVRINVIQKLIKMIRNNLTLENLDTSKVKSLSNVWLFVTLWTVAYQAPPSMGFSRQEYWSGLPFPSPGDLHWSGLPFPSPGDLPDPGIKPGFPTLEADPLTSESPGKPDTSKQRNNKYNSENVLRWWKNTIQVFQQTGTNTNHKCVRVFRVINANCCLTSKYEAMVRYEII